MAKKQGNDVIGYIREDNVHSIVDENGSFIATRRDSDFETKFIFTRDEIDAIIALDASEAADIAAREKSVPVQTDIVPEFPLQTLKHLMMIASRESGVEYELSQWGKREFTHEEIILLCYRIDMLETDAEISRQINKLARSGFVCKVKRNVYKACDLATLDFVDLLAQLDARAEARKNPSMRS